MDQKERQHHEYQANRNHPAGRGGIRQLRLLQTDPESSERFRKRIAIVLDLMDGKSDEETAKDVFCVKATVVKTREKGRSPFPDGCPAPPEPPDLQDESSHDEWLRFAKDFEEYNPKCLGNLTMLVYDFEESLGQRHLRTLRLDLLKTDCSVRFLKSKDDWFEQVKTLLSGKELPESFELDDLEDELRLYLRKRVEDALPFIWHADIPAPKNVKPIREDPSHTSETLDDTTGYRDIHFKVKLPGKHGPHRVPAKPRSHDPVRSAQMQKRGLTAPALPIHR